MKHCMILLLLLSLFPVTGLPDGNQLKTWCDDSDQMGQEPDIHHAASDTFLGGVCLGFIDATYRALNKRDFCGTSSTTRQQVVAVARKYLNDHPEKLGNDESQLVIEAFKQAFPCFQL